jgi:5-oxoprolinase (ATP-hydrolysing) subunit C
MNVALRVLSAGPGATIQDGGRHGYLRFGVTVAGPMDPLAHATANLAVGADRDAAAIEVPVGGIELAAEGGALSLAAAGGSFRIALDDRALPPAALARLEPGARLSIRPGAAGAWCYVAVAGRIDLPAVLGSLATHTRSQIGGMAGRTLIAGDTLPIATARALEPATASILAPWLDRPSDLIRVVLGPQQDYFADDQIDAFLTGPWTLSAHSDRMAYTLEGPRIAHAKGFNIVSDGIVMGAIQVLGEGRPIVLMADRQPTGGYPKIATVIGSDIGRLAQLRPGARFSFAAVSLAKAVEARRAESAALAAPIALEPLRRTHFPSEFLLARNLVGGVTAGADDGP